MRRASMLFAVVLLSTGCFHATIETGLPASNEVITKAWAHGFVYGLVPPSTVETAAKCKNGVAKVETQLSFLNMVASILTFSIYTPMQIDVTCASSTKMSALNGSADEAVIRVSNGTLEAAAAALDEAALVAIRTGKPSLVVF
jgi:hypothetical protein